MPKLRHLTLCTVVAGLTSVAGPVSGAEPPPEKDIAFLGADRAEKMDVYEPSAEWPRPAPAVIWIHGGSWKKGDKADAREQNVCSTLAANGYVAFSINYELLKEGGPAPWPQNFHDCKSALRYVRKEATRFGVDPDRIAISGGSAGGHLALLVGMTSGAGGVMNKGGLYTNQSNAVRCIVDFYGVAEISDRKWELPFTGTTPEETRANLQAAAPMTHLTKDSPPTLIVHGTADRTVDIACSRDLAAALQRLGVEHQLIEVPGAGHAFHLQPTEMDLRPAVLEFLGKHLRSPTKSG